MHTLPFNPKFWKVHSLWVLRLVQIGNLGLRLLWYFLHTIVSIWYSILAMCSLFESCFISYGVLKKYKSLNLGKLRYLAIVIESEDAHQTSKVVKLLQWLHSIGVKNVCLYDMNGMKLREPVMVNFLLFRPYINIFLEFCILGVLKKSKEAIFKKLKNAKSIEVLNTFFVW